MITKFMIEEITSLVKTAKQQNVKLSQEYIDALFNLDIEDIQMLKDSYESEKILS